MKLVVLGSAAAWYAELAARRPGVTVAEVADPREAVATELARRLSAARRTTDPFAAVRGDEDATVILSGRLDRAVDLARMSLQAGRRVILLDNAPVHGREWVDLSVQSDHRLVLSRPLRFDRLFATAKNAIRDGNVGTPRTVRVAWTFPSDSGRPVTSDPVGWSAELADVALWLLDDAPSTVYAQSCDVAGPPLFQVNLQTQTGSLALLEAMARDGALPASHELSLLTTNGALYHRAAQQNLLWAGEGVEVLSYPDEAVDDEIAAWSIGTAEGQRNLARGEAVQHNLRVTRAIAASLRSGEPVTIGEEVV